MSNITIKKIIAAFIISGMLYFVRWIAGMDCVIIAGFTILIIMDKKQ